MVSIGELEVATREHVAIRLRDVTDECLSDMRDTLEALSLERERRLMACECMSHARHIGATEAQLESLRTALSEAGMFDRGVYSLVVPANFVTITIQETDNE